MSVAMSSRADPGDGVLRDRVDNKAQQEFDHVKDSWIPKTPMKSVNHRRSSLIVDERDGSRMINSLSRDAPVTRNIIGSEEPPFASDAIGGPPIIFTYKRKRRRTFQRKSLPITQTYKRRKKATPIIPKSRGLKRQLLDTMGQMLVPYDHDHDQTKKKPKVKLDEESIRICRLLMLKGHVDDDDTDESKEKWWREERRLLKNKTDSFIDRMRIVQGDRRFSPWKGSVVDSVIGVFLTQSVSDHLSSSAFMSLASRFRSRDPEEGCILNLNEEMASDTQVYGVERVVGYCSGDAAQTGASPNLSDEICQQETATLTPNPSSSYEQSKDQQAQILDIEDFGKQSEGIVSPRVDKRKGASEKVPSTPHETNASIVREMKGKRKKPTGHWDSLRKDVEREKGRKERNRDTMDSINYEAVRGASHKEVAEAIRDRGMQDMLSVRIKDFLDRIVKDHGGINLEWLRDVPAAKAKDYLLSIRGLGLKSVECVRLLTLHKVAFPVDTNVGRIAVRLGWVPLEPLPESVQLHLLEEYPVLDSIQKYLWPRLCKLDHQTLYELHYQLITFGKVFCTKIKPNCNECPMRSDCKHFASAYASARLALPAPDAERSLVTATVPESFPPAPIPMMELPPPEKALTTEAPSNCVPIIEEPASPEPEYTQELTEKDLEGDYYNGDPDDEEIPHFDICMKQFSKTPRDVDWDMSKALVALDPPTRFFPAPKLKNISRLRTEHLVYELPDSHPLLYGMDKRVAHDPNPYLLAIWTEGESANSLELKCRGQASDETCTVGTLLIPSRTATRGSFPLNGTYFQVNELFADHHSSLKPIKVLRHSIFDTVSRKDFSVYVALIRRHERLVH